MLYSLGRSVVGQSHLGSTHVCSSMVRVVGYLTLLCSFAVVGYLTLLGSFAVVGKNTFSHSILLLYHNVRLNASKLVMGVTEVGRGNVRC
jgi:hypothetical protein